MLEEQNRHWIKGFFYAFPKHRELFKTLVKFIDKRQILAVTGLRRVGKTVLLWQMINYLIKKDVDRKRILYFSYDKAKLSIEELLNEYSKETGIDFTKERVYLFLDEIQKLENWQEQIKFYYDLYNIKFVVSGSSSLFMKKGIESLSGRIFEFYLPVLSFKEFLMFKGFSFAKKDINLYKPKIRQFLNEYIRKNFIEVLDEDETFFKIYYESIINKVIFEDIPNIFPVENPSKLKALFNAVLNNPGMYLNYDSLASDLSLSRKTVEKYVEYLIRANLIVKAYNFSKNFLTSEKKMKRLYLTAPCFAFTLENPKIESIVENIAFIFSGSKFFYRDPRKNEVDIITKKDGKIVPIEIKYKNKFNKNDLKALLYFLNKFNLKECMIITDDYESSEEIIWFKSKRKVNFLPLWKWLLK